MNLSGATMIETIAPSEPFSARIVPGLSVLAADYDVILCDVWGVIHNGEQFHRSATDALEAFRKGGGVVVLITNAPRPNGPVRHQLDGIGVPHACFDGIVTSGDVTLASIMERGNTPVHHIGPPRDVALFDAIADLGGTIPPLASLEEAGYVVVTGLLQEETDTPETYDPALALMLRRGLPMICANPDLVVHVGERLRYCAGAIAERYATQGGIIIYAGKPHAPIYDAALDLARKASGKVTDKARVLAIGDALRTDVAGAVLQGIDALFVTAGIHRDESHRTGDGRLDPEAYARMIEVAEHRPLAAIEQLTW